MKNVRQRWNWTIATAAVSAALLGAGAPALAQRSFGVDTSDWQGNIPSGNWATLKGTLGRDFAFLRSSRGGTTGVYNENDPNNTTYGTNTLSQRYDDYYFGQNITLATANGVFAGPYHFARADIIATTKNSGGIANTGTDEANHFIQMAGAWMRPGYLLPVLDMEAGNNRTVADLSTFCTNFSSQIYAVMGITPLIYCNSSYANDSLNSSVAAAMPILWIARPATNSTQANVQTNNPPAALPTYPNVYGKWNPSYPTIPNPQPWQFWQYCTTNSLSGFYSSSVDMDVAQSGLEYVKDYLVPAVWVTNGSGQWTTLSNWNSGQMPVAPPYYSGQPTPIGTTVLPTPCLPSTNDTVILAVPNTSVTVTLASGAQNIRKLYMRETLNITGGSLTINYIPSTNSTPIAAQFSGPVTLGGGASLSVHTLQVDATNTFTLNGGMLTFNTINLMPNTNSGSPAMIAMGGDMNFNALTNATATITNGAGSGSFGWINLGSATRAFNVTNGVGLFVYVPITNGALAKTGLGTLCLGVANPYTGGTTISAGTLALTNSGAINSSSQLSLAAGATFDVSAIATYNLSSSTTLSASGTGTTVGTNAAAIKGGTTVSLGSQAVSLTFTPTAFTGDTAHPALLISQGALTLSGNTITVNNAAATKLGAGTYRLIQVTGGTINGTPNATPTITGTGLATGTTASISVSGGNVNLVVLNTTTTTLGTVATPQTYGTVTFSATVSPSTATGTVTFKDGSTTLGTGTLSSGTAAFTPTASQLTVAGSPHSITAVYGGDSLDTGSTSSASPLTITAKSLTAGLTGTVSKTYDGTTAATLAAGNYSLPGVVSGDTVNLNNPASGTYDTRNVGAGKNVMVTGLAISGSSAGNYALSSTSAFAAIGAISQTNLTVTAAPNTKPYDGTTGATNTPTITAGSIQTGDTAPIWTETYDTKNAGTGKTLTPAGTVADGNGGANYNVTFANNTSGVITALTTSCLLTSSVNPSGPGTNVTFTATVNGVPPAADLPTSNVVFLANGTPFATNALVSGSISASTASLPLGTNAMTAQYVGDGNYLSSTGSVAQVVQLFVTCSQTNALLSMADNGDGTSTLTFVGTPQAEYYVLASPDVTAPMTNWTPVAGSTNTVTNVNGWWQFTVTNTAPQQFYRSTAVVPCP